MKKVFLDTNILVDVYKKREPQYEYSFKLFEVLNEDYEVFISAITVINFVYLCKIKDSVEIENFFNPFSIIETNADIISKAVSIMDTEFEDAVQAASALEVCDTLITWNNKHFAHFDNLINIYTPEEYLNVI